MNVAQSQGQEIGNEEFANQEDAQEIEQETESIQVIYNEKPFTGDAVWETSKIRKYLNEEFFTDAFNDDERKCVIDTNLVNSVVTDKGTIGGNDTMDKVFLLSVDDVINR